MNPNRPVHKPGDVLSHDNRALGCPRTIPPLKGVRGMLSARYGPPPCQKNIPLAPFKGGIRREPFNRDYAKKRHQICEWT